MSSPPTRPSARYPRLETLRRLGERLWNRRPDLQQAFPEVRSPEFWYWLMWHGVEEHAEVRDALYPQPEKHLTGRVVGEGTDELAFHRGGLVNWRYIDRCLREAGFEFDRGGDVLDFGCGCGRILRFFGFYADACNFHGADVDEDAVAWCAEHLDFGSFSALPVKPPSAYARGQFDAIYSYSVFTHLPETRHREWLEELWAISRPGAVLVLTVQGRNVMDMVLSGERSLGVPTAEELRARQEEIERRGFAFFPYRRIEADDPRIRDHFDRWDLEQYGMAFILEPYIRERWSDLFEVVAIHPALDDWQDHVVLRRR